jgi:hypothetical protein
MATPTRTPGDPIDPIEAKKEREALKKVKLRSFTATPPSIEALAASTLQWSVTGIPPDDLTVNLGVFLEDEEVAPTGSKTVSPGFTRTFHLNAKGSVANKSLGTTQVKVNFGACLDDELVPSLVTRKVKETIDAQVAGSRKVKPRGGSTVQLADFSVNVSIPLEIEVRGWFNADMDVSLRFSLFASSERVRSELTNASVDVSWTFLEHLAGLGITGIVQSAMQKLAEALFDLMGSLLADQLAGFIQEHVDTKLADLNAGNPPHPFHLHSMHVSELGLTFRFCPEP